MVRTYCNPPLIEAVCDFRFSSSQPWDWTIPGLFYEQIREKFPIKEQLNAVETIIDPGQAKFVQQLQPKLQFSTEKRDEVIQIGPDNLSLHQLPPYSGWMNFKESIIAYLQMYMKAANPTGLTSVALRYVNHIEISRKDIELEDYFNLMPQVPQPIPQIFPTFLLNIDVPYETPVSGLRIIFGTVVPKVAENLAYVLDLNMLSTGNTELLNNRILDWLEISHERVESAFDASFTEKAHQELFGGKQ